MIKNLDIEHIKKEFKKIQNYFTTGNYEKVIEKTEILLKKDKQVPFYNLLGLSYRQLGKQENAEEIFKKGLKIFPNNISILSNIGAFYRSTGKFDDAENYLNKALKLNNKDFTVLVNLANVKRDKSQNKESIQLYEQAYNLNKNNETLLINLAGAYQINAQFELSKKILKEINEKYPQNTKADHMYSSIHNYEEKDLHRDQMIQKLSSQNLSQENISNLSFAIAKSYSDIKNYADSSKFFIKANNANNNLLKNYDFKVEENIFKIIKNKFDNYKFKDLIQNSEPEIIFILGLPRSGTTLTHQIVSSHSKVFGAGELAILNNIFNSKLTNTNFLETFFDEKNTTNIKSLSNQIMSMFRQFDNKIILDKAPLNFRWIGFIKILFPNSKIIHCKRDLKDTALSIYKNVFDGGSLPWSYNQENLLKFVKMYDDLMQFWHEKLPDEIYDCHYEKLVNDQIEETKKLIKFCNLSWEENCIDYTKNDTGIKTVSISQARKPIYKTSVKLSDKYIDYLDFLKNI